ncbi:type I glutamate--ammonia ligase [Candidatus Micrarchaeota archaeon]|nr:type I glutamate--ammonia ligase [Candidatus Micrarchaeota archaeon]
MSQNEAIANVLKEVKEKEVKFISLQFTDLFGRTKNLEITSQELEGVMNSGIWFDGSSIQGFMRIFESDMFLMPDPSTFAVLPWGNGLAKLTCDVYGNDGKPFEGDPRYILKKMEAKAKEAGFTYKVGPEIEFFLFRDSNGATLQPDPHDSAGYFDLGPLDAGAEVRYETIEALNRMGLTVERGHHEVAMGQHEINFKFDNALTMADKVLAYKNVVKVIAKKHGLYASFMPKPIFGVNGSGMHTNQSLWKDGENAFFDANDEKYKLSKNAKGYIAGQIEHAREFSAVAAPTVNSYKRLVPGYEAPVYICWARINRSAMIRVPEVRGVPKATRIELRFPDPSCNPYLSFAAMLAAGLDGIKRGLVPPDSVEENIYHFDDEKLKKFYIKTLPKSLEEATEEFANSALMKETLGKHVFDKIVEAQRKQWDEYRIRVTPWEIKTYLPVL